ncbi:hypothetical protein BGZ83_005542 [Gryganskiella cystojenkinii]|nr:hypothetical protein BGZ83_005542 [Gryganskiella cystojenkinii]
MDMVIPIHSWSTGPLEIIALIASHLPSPSDRATCVLVSKAWANLWTPSLWHRVILKTHNQCLSFVSTDTQAALERYVHYMRVFVSPEGLGAGNMLLGPSLANRCRLLQELELEYPLHMATLPLVEARPRIQAQAALVAESSSSSSSPSSSMSFFHSTPAKRQRNQLNLASSLLPLDLTITLMRQNPDLKRLSLKGDFIGDDYMSKTLFTSIQSNTLVSLSLDIQQPSFHKLRSHSDPKRLWIKKLPLALPALIALQHFSIGRHIGSNDLLLVFLGRCPNLQKIEFHEIYDWILDLPQIEFFKQLPILLPKLEELVWDTEVAEGSNDRILAAILNISRPGWKSLEIRPVWKEFNELSTQALLAFNTVSRIESFISQGLYQFHDSSIQQFLESATSLKHFTGLTRSKNHIYPQDLALHPAFLYDPEGDNKIDPKAPKPWACAKSLETLAIRLHRIPRSDILFHIERPERDLDQESCYWTMMPTLKQLQQDGKDMHRLAYTQLGALINLKELILGHSEADMTTTIQARSLDDIFGEGENYSEGSGGQGTRTRRQKKIIRPFHYDCLSFSLESGLELLNGMKELRVLDVSWTAHRIGVKELEWMHIHWPKLRRIDGLMGHPGWADEEFQIEVREKVAKWIEEHPHGIGCSYYL